MAKVDYPVTPAIRALREHKIALEPHLFPYEEHGGTRHSAEMLGVPEHQVVKTLVMETDVRQPLIVLMHGDREVSTRQLARLIGARSVTPCAIERAQKLTGYMVGGISPFGTRTSMAVYVQSSILELERIYINGGKRGFLVGMAPEDLRAVLAVQPVDVAIVD